MKIGPITGCIFILLIFAILLSTAVIFVMEVIEKILIKIRRKRAIKKLKGMPIWNITCIDSLEKDDKK